MDRLKTKIGIVTIHMINNYGAILQAFALNYYLNSLGYDAETIDFRTYRVAESYKLFSPIRSFMDLVRTLFSLPYLWKINKRHKRMKGFIQNNIKLSKGVYHSNSELYQANLDYDYYICGSDQIWNTYCDNYDDAFILAFARNKGRRISYAASMGMPSIHENLQSKFRAELSDFNALSVRESNAVDVISQLSGKKTVHVMDPVFLLTQEQWKLIQNNNITIKKPYILFYAVHGEIPGMRPYVQKLSKHFNIPVVVINKNLRELQYPNKKCYDAGPAEFVSLIQGAKYVFTNSFHGSAFSILFHKKFQVYVAEPATKGTTSRIYSLLNTLGLSDRIAFMDKDPSSMDHDINWDEVNERLTPMIESSKAFLDDALRTT